LIREGKTFQIPSMMQVGRAQGMIALNDALADLVKKGLVTAEEALTRAIDKNAMTTLLNRKA
jgi:twitching motility protein PilT